MCAAHDVEIHSDESTRSDAEVFHHTVPIRITRDGKSCFKKDWSVSARTMIQLHCGH